MPQGFHSPFFRKREDFCKKAIENFLIGADNRDRNNHLYKRLAESLGRKSTLDSSKAYKGGFFNEKRYWFIKTIKVSLICRKSLYSLCNSVKPGGDHIEFTV